MTAIREKVREFIFDKLVFEMDSAAIADETDLKGSNILDSLAILRLIAFIDNEFQVRLKVEDLESSASLSLARIENLMLTEMSSPSLS